MINQYVHRIWDSNAVGSKDVTVVCPTSQYDLDSRGFSTCPICEKMSALYKQSQEGSSSAKELYSKFKRTLRGYVPVYVVNGPAEDIGKVKILQYTISFKKYFDSKIFGIVDAAKNNDDQNADNDTNEEDNIVGLDAFMYYDPKNDKVVTTGYNFIITVGTKKVPMNGKTVEMNDYKLDFAMKPTKIEEMDGHAVTSKYFCSLSKELNFDEDFYVMHSLEKIQNFKMKYIDGEDADDHVIEEEEAEEVPVKQPKKAVVEEEEEEVEVPAPKKKTVPKEEPEEEPEEQEEKSSDDDDIDLDELLKDI
jgi:hypothetical protein